MRSVRQNLALAFVDDLLGVPLAAGVPYSFFGMLLSPMIAAPAMSLRSVSVIGNALRLGRPQRRASEALMCELFAMSARFPTTIHLSVDELARHGGGSGPRDGWGIAFAQQGDALVVREPGAVSESACHAFLQQQDIRSETVIAHIRRATQGTKLLRNTQPFSRELGGVVHVFAHNGMLPGIETDARFPTRRFLRVGDTDSEHAFCALLERIAPTWSDGLPSLDARLAAVVAFADDLREVGPANFIYSDGDAVFAHGHRRKSESGEILPPGLYVLCRSCAARSEGVPLTGVAIGFEEDQQVALLASVPLSRERWEPLSEGEIVVLRKGRLVQRRALVEGKRARLRS